MNGLGVRLQQVAAQVPAGASVLDVGCSDGRLLAYLRDAGHEADFDGSSDIRWG